MSGRGGLRRRWGCFWVLIRKPVGPKGWPCRLRHSLFDAAFHTRNRVNRQHEHARAQPSGHRMCAGVHAAWHGCRLANARLVSRGAWGWCRCWRGPDNCQCQAKREANMPTATRGATCLRVDAWIPERAMAGLGADKPCPEGELAPHEELPFWTRPTHHEDDRCTEDWRCANRPHLPQMGEARGTCHWP